MTSENNDILYTIHACLVDATIYGLTTEVVYSALMYLKDNPEKSVKEAIAHGYYEWIK